MAAWPEKRRTLQLGMRARVAIAASMPVMPVMMTSEMSMLGLEGVERFEGLFAAVDGASLKACLVKNDGEGVGDHLFIVGDEDAWLGRCGGGCFRHAVIPDSILVLGR